MRWLLLLVCVACAAPRPRVAAHPEEPLPFIQDDYARAVSQARASGRAIFVETWAPW